MNFVPIIPQDLRKTASPTFANIKDSGLTSGRMTYAGTDGLLQDSANLTFDGTNLTCLGDITGDNLNVSSWNLKADYAFGANSFTGSGDFSGGEILGTSLESEGGLIVTGAALISTTLGVTGVTTLDSTLYIKETASGGSADVAGYGQLYCKDNAGTTELWFVDDSGTETQLA